MTMTVANMGVDVAHEDLPAVLRQELDAARNQAKRAQASDVEATLAALDRLSEFIKAVDGVRWSAGHTARGLIKQALQAGVDPRDLYDRPFSDKIVRDLIKELNLEPKKRGPRPRSQPGDSTAG